MKIILDKVPIIYPRRNMRCIAFTATAALVAAMVAAGIPVRRHPIEPWQFVSPEYAFTRGKLWELLQDSRFKYIAVVTFLVSPTGSNQTFNVPTNWNAGNNKTETIAGGGSGGAAGGQFTTVSSSATGAGAGAYSAVLNLALTPGGTATYQIGAGGASVTVSHVTSATNGNSGGDSWFNGATLGASSVGSKAGVLGVATNGAGAQTGGAGGSAASGVGTTKKNGGAGGNTPGTAGGNYASSGGGGAGGPNGDGSAGTQLGVNQTGVGGAADNSTVAGGTAGGSTGGNGNSGTEFDGSHGCGSGGGGALSVTSTAATAGAGGNYGGGGAGAAGDSTGSGVSGAGAQGIIVVTNVPATRGILAWNVFG